MSLLGLAVASTGCSMVGWKYDYGGRHYTMTKENSDYHAKAIRDVRTRYGDPQAQTDIANLKGACELFQKYAAEAPDPGSFTPARELLDADVRSTCARWHQQEHRDQQATDEKNRRDEVVQVREARSRQREEESRQRDTERREQYRRVITQRIERESKVLEACEANAPARANRRRHEEIARSNPAAALQKQCAPQRGTKTVKSECRDANGFTRTCSKSVPGEVIGYACPKSMDTEVVQIGLHQLGLLDTPPYPEDDSIQPGDETCEKTQASVKKAREMLEESAGTTTGALQ
ncbi:hypothetical protein AKJ09_08864 [Labilithrix luteola]|uniref:Uncharacterized protein n=1 Tax=Labilithrix luteola TaxID=1391654 RepID=A0A0K1Q8S5_9BACT|nr:hypothetical protein AKJ09_08864 [Labilithrix luteola]